MINKKTILFALLVCIYSCGKKEPINITPEPTYEYNPNSEQVSDPNIEQTEITEIADNETITTAQKLATLDSDSPETIQFDDYRVLEIQKHLYRLSKTFNETEENIGNITYNTIILLKKEKGLNYSNIRLLRAADKNLDDIKDSGITYAEFMALVAMMTEE